jgi:hypothetical protein
MLFIVAALAALAIDLVTFYTARSEAQLAADSIALAGARTLANSGLTSDPTDANLRNRAENLACNIALQEASQNQVGGRNLLTGPCPGSAEVTISFDNTQTDVGNPRVVVRVSRADLPTFFARIWGRTQIAVGASAIAEAYNPSGHGSISLGSAPPIAPSCVKPWLLPNIDPLNPPNPIFDPAGTIQDTNMLGKTPPGVSGNGLGVACPTGNCQTGVTPMSPWQYYPGSQTDFPAPSQALPVCSAGFAGSNKAYQLSIAGCVQSPVVCGQNSSLTLDISVPGSQIDGDTAAAVTCLTHAQNDQADRVDTPPPPPKAQPFQFIVGNDNPVVNARGHDVMVSSSLVTVPVVDATTPIFNTPAKVIGFVQVFLNPDGNGVASGAPAMIVNLAGCGPNLTGQPILGNGASPVAVRLISR